MFLRPERASTLCQYFQTSNVTLRQGRLLRMTPSLQLPFGGDRIGDLLKVFGPYQAYRSPCCGVTTEMSCIVLTNSRFERVPSRADVERTITTFEHVDERTHRSLDGFARVRFQIGSLNPGGS